MLLQVYSIHQDLLELFAFLLLAWILNPIKAYDMVLQLMMQGNQNAIYSLRGGAYLLVERGFSQVTRSCSLGMKSSSFF